MNRQGFGGNPSMHIHPGTTIRSSDLTEEDVDELNAELTRVEDEIQTLRQVLLAKEKYAMDIRRQLGTTPLNSIKNNLAKGWQDVQTSTPYMTAATTLDDISNSNAYKRTQESLSYAGQVTTAALSTVGVSITRRLADMRTLALPSSARPLAHSISVPAMRPSSTFRSFEEMVGSVKDKVAGGRGDGGNTSGFERPSSRRTSRDGPF
ncbi:tumor protein D54 [Gadus morhua]|uniref:Tpd52 like 2a n=1 Tax=Gadus morhua TaxID=8049 RepID=A0A8C4ZU18_GADMO|nr:tumor protein D54-like [Gadus morhua]